LQPQPWRAGSFRPPCFPVACEPSRLGGASGQEHGQRGQASVGHDSACPRLRAPRSRRPRARASGSESSGFLLDIAEAKELMIGLSVDFISHLVWPWSRITGYEVEPDEGALDHSPEEKGSGNKRDRARYESLPPEGSADEEKLSGKGRRAHHRPEHRASQEA
jgi:hypothetical protein